MSCWNVDEVEELVNVVFLFKECLPETHQKYVISLSIDDAQIFFFKTCKKCWMYFLPLFCQSKRVNETELYLCLSYGRTTWELLSSQRKHGAISCFTCFLPEARTTIHFSISAGLFPSRHAPQSAQTLVPLALKSAREKNKAKWLRKVLLMHFPSKGWLLCQDVQISSVSLVHSSAIALEYFTPSLPREGCQGPGGHSPHDSLSHWCVSRRERLCTAGIQPQMLKERLGLGNREEEP